MSEKMNGMKLSLTFIAGLLITFGVLQAQVLNNSKDIEQYQDIPIQVARIEQNVKNINDNFSEFKKETLDGFKNIGDKMDKILLAINK